MKVYSVVHDKNIFACNQPILSTHEGNNEIKATITKGELAIILNWDVHN